MIISKSNTLKEDDVLRIFNTTNDLEKIDNAVTNAGGRLYTSWASVDVIDKDNEKIPIEDLIKQQQILLERNGPITDNHTNKVVGETLSFKVLEHPESKTMGVLHLNKIFDHYKIDDKVWAETKNGDRTGSSVGGESDSVRMESKDGRRFGVIEGFNHLETASVYSPANQLSTNQAISVAKGSLANPNDIAGVAKLGDTSKPPQLDRCVEAVMLQGRSEESAHAICTESLKKTNKGLDALFSILSEVYGMSQEDFDQAVSMAYPEGTNMTEKTSVEVIADNLLKGNFITGDEQKQLSDAINRIKMKSNKDINKEVDDKVYEDSTEDKMKTKIQDNQKSELETLKSKVAEMEKLLANKRGEEEEEEEKRDMPEEATEEEVEEKGEHEDDEEEDTTKEEAASDIDGLSQATSPDSPKPDESNDADVFKQLMAKMDKLEKAYQSTQKKGVKKSLTPRAGGSVEKKDVKKSYAEQLATGEIKKKWSEVHRAVKAGEY